MACLKTTIIVFIISCAHLICTADDIERYIHSMANKEWEAFNKVMAHRPIFQRGNLESIKSYAQQLVKAQEKFFIDAEGHFVDTIPDTVFKCRLGVSSISDVMTSIDSVPLQREQGRIILSKVKYKNECYDEAFLCFDDSVLCSVEIVKYFRTYEAAGKFYKQKQKEFSKAGHTLVKSGDSGQDIILSYDGKIAMLMDCFATLNDEKQLYLVRTTIVLL